MKRFVCMIAAVLAVLSISCTAGAAYTFDEYMAIEAVYGDGLDYGDLVDWYLYQQYWGAMEDEDVEEETVDNDTMCSVAYRWLKSKVQNAAMEAVHNNNMEILRHGMF